MPRNVFLESPKLESLSVDRHGLVPDSDMAAIAERAAVARRKTFFGWAVVSVRHASQMSRRVEPTPLLDIPFHADIYLNLPEGAERRDTAKQHTLHLAKGAKYRPRPGLATAMR